MKKTLYMLLLLLCACTLGGFIATTANGSMEWLGYTLKINFQPGTFLDTEMLSLTFGISFSISVAQVLLILTTIFVYCKTAPKIFTGK